MVFACAVDVENQLPAHYGVGERVNVELACHLYGVGVCWCFGDLNESLEAVVCQPFLESGGDDDCHFVGGVGRRGWKLGARGRERGELERFFRVGEKWEFLPCW